MSNEDRILSDLCSNYRNVNAADSCGQSRLNLVIDTPLSIPTPMVYSQITGCCTSTGDRISNKAPEKKAEKPKTPLTTPLTQTGLIDHFDEFREFLVPEKILFKPPATIVFWKDGTKTVVKCMEGETFNEYFGFLAALGKKIFGTNSELNRIVKRGQFPKEFKVPEKPSVVQEAYETIQKCITGAIKSPEKKKPASNPKTNKKGAKK